MGNKSDEVLRSAIFGRNRKSPLRLVQETREILPWIDMRRHPYAEEA